MTHSNVINLNKLEQNALKTDGRSKTRYRLILYTPDLTIAHQLAD